MNDDDDDSSRRGDDGGSVDGQKVTAATSSSIPKRTTMLQKAAEAERLGDLEDKLRAPEKALAREKNILRALGARKAGGDSLMQLIMGNPGVRALVTPVDGKQAFELTQEEADELFRLDFNRRQRPKGSHPHQRKKR